MKMHKGALILFPTEPAKRRYELRTVFETGVLDTSRLLTQRRLLDRCERAARRAGLLSGRRPGFCEQQLLLEEAVQGLSFAPEQPLNRLSPSARASLLERLIEKLAFTAEGGPAVIQWLLAHDPAHKLHGFGQMLTAWGTLCAQRGIADRFAVNAAILQLIESGELPAELEDGLEFRAVRWFNPFEERLAAALKKRLGPDRVQIFSVLPPAHAETAEDRLCSAVRSELERGNENEWNAWTEDFADALETNDGQLLTAASQDRLTLRISANPYGEIEDAARSIAGEIERGTPPCEIALIVRDIGPYADMIPDVFTRFGIPCHFRRGTPAAALPPVKALLALLAFPYNPRRDRLCDLLRNPSIAWPGMEDREETVQALLKNEPPVLSRLPKELRDVFQPLDIPQQIETLIDRHGLQLPPDVLDLTRELSALRTAHLPADRMIRLLEGLLDNINVSDPADTESGVWILNPMDAAGLRFDCVFAAGMDDRSFPQIPEADALLNRTDRQELKAFLDERGMPCPRLALSETGEMLIQEEILFLSALSTANERLTLSYCMADTDGKEREPGIFFERMRDLTGKTPEQGVSFHTILPPAAVRAEDEARQTAAWLSATAEASPSPRGPAIEKIQPLILQWLETHPEFSATALESLARNRFVFFLEKILSIKPDRTHEDDTDPIDRGNVIHDILEQVYTAIAGQSDLYADNTAGSWTLAQSGAIALAVFDPAKADELLALTREIAEREFVKAERRPSRHLGHRAVWANEKRQILQIVENVVRMDIETAQAENRYPALFEMKFDEKHDLPVTLMHPDCRAGTAEDLPGQQPRKIRLKGKIDRIDLVFDDEGGLSGILVADYKGTSRGISMNQLEKEIGMNLDCQLPLYTFAAQMKFFGACNTPELNEKVQAVYHLQERNLKDMTKHFTKKRLMMTPALTDAFLETLFSNVGKLCEGDLAAEPLVAHYEDYSHICRTAAIDPKDLLNRPVSSADGEQNGSGQNCERNRTSFS